MISRWKLAVFSGPAIPQAALGLPLVVFLPEYYADNLAVPLGLVGLAFAVIRGLDIPIDPMLGAMMDHTRTRYGRFKPWMAAAAPILMVSIYMLFMAHRGVGPVYLGVWLLFAYLGLSMATLAGLAWGSTLQTHYQGRSRVYTWIQGTAVVGAVLVLVLPAALAKVNVGGAVGGVQSMGWFAIVLIPLTFTAALRLIEERPVTTPRPRVSLGDYVRVMNNGTVLRLLGADLSLSTASAAIGGLFFFYLEQLKGFSKGDAEILLLFYFLSALVGGPIWLALGDRLGKHRALAIACAAFAVTLLLAGAVPPRQFWVMMAAMPLAGLPYSASSILVRSMLGDVADQERLRSGEDRTGLFYAISSGNVKIANAVAVGVTFGALQLIGFNPTEGAVNSPAALAGLGALFAIAPAVLGLLAAALILGYPLTAERHAEIRRRLDEIDAAAALERHEPHAAE